MKSYELKPTSENLLTTFQDDMIGRNAVVKALQLRIYHHLRFLKIILSLSPLAEQKRIVAKLEEILPLCERLK